MKAKTKSSNKSHNRHFSNIPKNETKPEKKNLRYYNMPAAILTVVVLAVIVFIIAKQFDRSIVGKSFEEMYFEQYPPDDAQDKGIMKIEVNVFDGAIPDKMDRPIRVSVLKVGDASPVSTSDIIGSGIIQIPSGYDFYYVMAIDPESRYYSYDGYGCKFMNQEGTYLLNNICLSKSSYTGCGSCD